MLPLGVPIAWMGQWIVARERAASQLRVSGVRSRVRWLLERALSCNVGGGSWSRSGRRQEPWTRWRLGARVLGWCGWAPRVQRAGMDQSSCGATSNIQAGAGGMRREGVRPGRRGGIPAAELLLMAPGAGCARRAAFTDEHQP